MRRGLAGAVVALMLMGAEGCTTPPPTGPTPEPPRNGISAPANARTLAELGLKHGPSQLWLPADVTIRDVVDLETNVTLTFTAPSGEELAEWLRTNLPAAGFQITADGQDSLLFDRGQWQGAFTVTGDLSAISLRTDRE